VRGHENLGHGCRRELVEVARDGRDVPLVHDDPVGEATAADDPKHAVAHLEAPGRRAAGDHSSGGLDAGHIGRRAGRSGVAAGPLREVGAVESSVPHREQHVVAGDDGVWSLLEAHHLVAARAREDDCSHVVRAP
jgi:hypothetical protein